MTYVYSDQTAVLGPLSTEHVPGAFDLCGEHAERTSVPRGWEVIRLPIGEPREVIRFGGDDLMALADAIRAVGLRDEDPEPVGAAAEPTRQAGHLRLVPSLD